MTSLNNPTQTTDLPQATIADKLLDKNDTLDPTEVDAADLSGDEGEPQVFRDESQKSSLPATVLTLINTTIGAGVLGLPYVMRQLGIVLGLLLLALGGILLAICSDMLQKTKNFSRHSNYVTIAQHCYKSKGYKLLAGTLLLNNLGSCVIFLSIFGTVAENLMTAFVPACGVEGADQPFYCTKPVILSTGTLFILPFNFPKTLEKMQVASFFKVVAIVMFTTITFGFYSFKAITGQLTATMSFAPNYKDPVGVLACVTQVFFAYCFIFNQFMIYKSIRKASDARLKKVVRAGMGLTTFVYITVAMSGYAIFGEKTDNLLKNFQRGELGTIPFVLLNVAFMLSSLMSFPPNFVTPRNLIYQKVMELIKTEKQTLLDDSQIMNGDDQPNPRAKSAYFLVIVTLNIMILILCIYAPGLNTLFGLVGSIATDSLIFLFPPLFYISLNKSKKGNWVAYALIVLGGILAALGTATNLIKMFQK